MSKNLCNKVGEVGQDNLIAKLFPTAETFGIKVNSGEGGMKRGTVLALTDEGKYVILDATSAETAEANCILADDVEASEGEVTAVAYRTGHFNSCALITGDDYDMTKKDVEALRKGGILLSEMMD